MEKKKVHTIRLPNGKSCSVAKYVAAWKELKAMHPTEQVYGFGWFPQQGGEVLKAMRDGLTDRINRHDPSFGKGRKWKEDWQRGADRIASNINGRRIVTYRNHCPKELQAKLAHRLYEYGEV